MTRKKVRWVVLMLVLLLLVALIVFFLNKRGTTDIIVEESIQRITIASTAFDNMNTIPDRYTGNGEDISPDFHLSPLSENAVSIAIIMDDLDVPWKANYTHWVIWNIPAQDSIAEAIPHGESVASLDGAVQGVAFGRNRYRGPKPPFGTHRYQYHVFVLDGMLDLDSSAGKPEVLAAMEGHVLQYGSLTGWYPRTISKETGSGAME